MTTTALLPHVFQSSLKKQTVSPPSACVVAVAVSMKAMSVRDRIREEASLKPNI